MNLDKQNLASIRDVLDRILMGNEELKALGVTAQLGSCRYEPKLATFKLKVIVLGDCGKEITPWEAEWHGSHRLYGFEADDLGREFRHFGSGKTYKIVGLNRKAKKYPVIGQDQDGRTYKFAAHVVKKGLSDASRSGGSARAS